jgi:two-component system CheB/CheR fusion protein
VTRSRSAPAESPAVPPDFLALLEHVKRARGFDFGGYKPASLIRRVTKRLEAVGVDSFAAYSDYLEVHPEEFGKLFDTVLINVTAFFRDESAWETLRTQVLPLLLASKPPDAPIRVWSAACATGEEAYTLAIVLAEALGVDAFKERVKIYATDLDEHALNVARHATYSERAVEAVPPALLEEYFERVEAGFCFRQDLRRTVIFGRHDLIQDAPISRVDLLSCRNALMYLNAETQARILARFHFALNDDGILFLGRAETLLTQSNLFAPVDLKRRIFARSTRTPARERLLLLASGTDGDRAAAGDAQRVLFESAFDTNSIAQLVVDHAGSLALANERARSMFRLSREDVGRPLQDLELSYRPLELRSLIDRAYAERRAVVVRDVEWPGANESRTFDVQVSVLSNGGQQPLGVAVTFTDATVQKRLQRELEHAHQELEAAYEELQSTNEELETTNEELQSTIEELETTNEELQSTNEELETMNEELQSTNEELSTINDELRRRGVEVNELNAFLESVFTSLRGAVVVLDRDLQVTVWNARAEELWGLREAEVVGRNFLNLDFGLPVDQLRAHIRSSLNGGADGTQVTVPATNRRGKMIEVRVTCMPLVASGRSDVRGVILMME